MNSLAFCAGLAVGAAGACLLLLVLVWAGKNMPDDEDREDMNF